ncbi:MAG: prolipoprotein diacylglyceryl transferase [bacterium]
MREILFHIPLPAWKIGAYTLSAIPVRSFSVMVFLGVLIGLWFVRRMAIKRGYHADTIDDLIFYTVLGGMIGTRLGYVVTNWSQYADRPGDIFKIWLGGLSLHGMIIGGMLAYLIYCWIRKVSPWLIGDFFALGLPIGTAIGRIGCFLNVRDDYGIRCTEKSIKWLCVQYPWDTPNTLRYAWPLFETAVHIPTFLILYGCYIKGIGRKGEFFFYWVIVYSVERFILEYWRWGDTAVVLWNKITVAQLFSIPIILGCLITLYLHRRAIATYQKSMEAGKPKPKKKEKEKSDTPGVKTVTRS